MSWKSYACLAAVAAMTAPAVAQTPTIALVDNGGTATLNITSSVAGSLGAEIGITLSGVTLGSVTPNLSEFIPNPGDNPFAAGSPIGGDVGPTGIFTDAGAGQIFASFGSNTSNTPAGTYELFTFDYTGSGSGDASGIVAQLGALGEVQMDLAVALTDGGGGIYGDFDNDGDVDGLDFVFFGEQFAFGTVPPADARADNNSDGNIDGLDFVAFGENFANFPPSAASAIPEPTALLLGMIGLVAVGAGRRA